MDDHAPITCENVRDFGTETSRVFFDLDGQTVDALELVLEHLKRLPDRPWSWKWIVIGMHAALQGSFCLALRRTDGAQLLVRWQERQFWERVSRERASFTPEAPIYERLPGYEWRSPVRSTNRSVQRSYSRKVRSTRTHSSRASQPQTDRFLGLFDKTRKVSRMDHFDGVPLRPTQAQTRSIKELNSLRNHLIHFSDAIVLNEVPAQFANVTNGLNIIETLLTRTQGMAEGSYGPINTIVDHRTADCARQLIEEVRSELMAASKRCGLSNLD